MFLNACKQSPRFVALSALLTATSIVNGMPIFVTPLEYEHISSRSASCYPVTLEQLQKREYLYVHAVVKNTSEHFFAVPAWNKVIQYAEEHWGAGGGVHVNDPKVRLPSS